MAKTVATKRYFSFTGGLNTEGGPLSFPPNTWQDGDNVVPDVDGSLDRRTAVNYESAFALSTQTHTLTQEQADAFTVGEWTGVAGEGNRNFVVVQRANLVYFYDNVGDSISATQKAFTLDLTTYTATGTQQPAGRAPISCVSAVGKLILVASNIEPVLVTYNPDTDTISHQVVTVQIRDLLGTSDGLAVDNRPATLSAAHKYNLYNQGWPQAHIDSYFTATTKYPSNAQVWTAGKDSTDTFSVALLDKQDFGTTPAAKGRFVLSLFNRDRSTASGVAGIATETESFRPTTCAFYAGRAWFAGVKSKDIGSWVVFSQVADTSDKFGKCYQEADPTSEHISDLVDTDGGVVPLQDAGQIIKLVAAYNSILVFADNGVWQIVGGLESGFSATAYEVRKVSVVGCVGPEAVVEASSAVFFWSHEGIWAIKPNQAGALFAESLSDNRIRSFVVGINANAKAYVQGKYFSSEHTIYWLFNGNKDADGVLVRFKKSRLLCLDLQLGAFYTHTIGALSTLSPYTVGAVVSKHRTTFTQQYNVVDSVGNNVVDSSSNQLVANIASESAAISKLKFLTVVPQSGGTTFKATFATFEDGAVAAAKFKDWYSADSIGASFAPFITTGYDLGADQGGDKALQALYITTFMRRTETGTDSSGNATNPSSCLMQARWDWADSAAAGKWGVSQEVYRHRRLFLPPVPSSTFDDGYPVVVSKTKIRGRGKALHLRFAAGLDKDMQLLGWSIPFLGNTNV